MEGSIPSGHIFSLEQQKGEEVKAIATGFMTIIGSKKLEDDVKKEILDGKDGKVPYIVIKLYDENGEPFKLRAQLKLSRKGSLTGAFVFRAPMSLEMEEFPSTDEVAKRIKVASAVASLKEELLELV